MPTEANSGDQNADQNQKIVFDERQQQKVNELIQEAQGRAARELRSELETSKQTVTSLQTELETAKAAVKKGTPEERKGAKDDVANLTAQIDEMKRAGEATKTELDRFQKLLQQKDVEVQTERTTANNIRKQVAIQGAAGKLGFVDLSQITKLTEDSVKYDAATGRHVVLNEAGQPRLNSAFEPMSLDEFYAEFSSKNPHLVRGDVKNGLGSTPSQRTDLTKNGKYAVEDIFGPKADSAKANNLAKQDIAEYRRLKEIARASKLIKF